MTTLADLVASVSPPDGTITEVVATGGPADVTLLRDEGTRVHAVRVNGYTTLVEGADLGWEVIVHGAPIQVGVRVRGIGIAWGTEVVELAAATEGVE